VTTWRGYKARVPLRGEAARAYEAARDELGIGYLILKARVSAGLTQRELAARIGSSQPTVARWESGAQLPSVRSLTRIAEATGFHLTVGLRRGEAPGRAFLNVGVQA
jgi:transcriptional regulator with XRE-family HTH domain